MFTEVREQRTVESMGYNLVGKNNNSRLKIMFSHFKNPPLNVVKKLLMDVMNLTFHCRHCDVFKSRTGLSVVLPVCSAQASFLCERIAVLK